MSEPFACPILNQLARATMRATEQAIACPAMSAAETTWAIILDALVSATKLVTAAELARASLARGRTVPSSSPEARAAVIEAEGQLLVGLGYPTFDDTCPNC